MKYFNADGTIKRDNENDEDFGWIWKNLLEDRGMKMVIYNSDGSVKSEEYYNESNDWEIVTDNDKDAAKQEAVNSMKWYQRTFSNIQEGIKTNLSNLLISLDNKESHLILSIINNAILSYLPDTKLRKPTRISTAPRYADINNDVTRTLRLKRLYGIFDIGFNYQLLQKRYLPLSDNKSANEVNKYVEDYLEVVHDLKQILCWNVYPQLDSGPKRVEIDKSKEPYTDIDQTLLKLLDKTCEMHCEVEKIRKCFLEYENKIEMLLKECKNVSDDIFECEYLDNIILCLNYKIEDVNFDWPFKFGDAKDTDSSSRNLII
ncbi:hypothetical protein QE152_g21503 [Popillia japonica]|uniref:Uncharacterized protein n=1 Tax=Popillia japonica TaxID=7064 RepID=A0AAW1KP99_POPJA